jgi:RNA 3'-terminal phosphate cyclase
MILWCETCKTLTNYCKTGRKSSKPKHVGLEICTRLVTTNRNSTPNSSCERHGSDKATHSQASIKVPEDKQTVAKRQAHADTKEVSYYMGHPEIRLL